MKIIINETNKINVFISLCNLLKKSTSIIKLNFNKEYLHIQGMDKGMICLYDVKLYSSWFYYYEISTNKDESITIDLNTFSSVLSLYKEGNEIIIFYDNNYDEELNIHFEKDNSNKNFIIPLINYENDLLKLPESIYNVEITIESKKIVELTNQLLLFGDDLNIECLDEKICFNTLGEKGKMKSFIHYDNLKDYSINLDDDIKATFSLIILNKICLTTYLSEFLTISISDEIPMKITYPISYLSNEIESYVSFYIAPKLNDNEV
jgi:proliferating cell nuclear antigen PCNA